MTDNKVLLHLTKLHSLLNEINTGNTPYCQYYTLRKINGETCQYLEPIANKTDLSPEIKAELALLIQVLGSK